jgi:type IV pilus assembly protein PilV
MTDNRTNQKKCTSINGQNGVGLIDVMVAILIFSVGMLAIAALQSVSKQSNYEAIQRTNATLYAHDLFERMRMNSYAEGDSPYPPLSYYVDSSTVVMNYSGPLVGTTSTCASTDLYCLLAQEDLTTWQNMLRGNAETTASGNVGGLVQPTACLSGPGGGVSGQYRLTIAWRGQTKITNQSANNCGEGTNLYDDAATDDFAYRRILVLNTYLNY